MNSRADGTVILPPGRGEGLDYGDGDRSLVKATTETTRGAFSVLEHVLQPGGVAPPLHEHRQLCEAFYVLEGTLTLWHGDERIEAPAGTFACFPPGAPHTFANRSSAPVRLLNVSAPGGWERVLRGVAQRLGERPADGPVALEFDRQVLEDQPPDLRTATRAEAIRPPGRARPERR